MTVAVVATATLPPVTTPVPGTTGAIADGVLVHVPPAVASLSVVVLPVHTVVVPVIAAGNGLTVMTADTLQPLGARVYTAVAVEGTVTVPPVTTPVPRPIVAGPLMLQEPPPVALVSVMVLPLHTLAGPPMAAGNAVTVTMAVVVQPVPRE